MTVLAKCELRIECYLMELFSKMIKNPFPNVTL